MAPPVVRDGIGRLSTLEVARAEELRQARGTAAVTTEAAWLGGGVMTWDHPGSWANQAVGFADEPLSHTDLDQLEAFYFDRGAPAVVELCAFAHPTLLEALGERGFRLDEVAHVLAIATEDLPHGMSANGISIRELDRQDPSAVRELVLTAARGFDGEDAALPEPEQALMERIARDPSVVSLLACIDGEPAGAAQISPTTPVAAMFAAGVRVPFRRRGVHQALIHARLDAVRDADSEVVVVEGPPGGPTERNARRAGFQLAYAKIKLVKPLP